jgi:H+-transporting ATPase
MSADNSPGRFVAAGLSSAEAARRLAEFGPNAVAEEREHPARRMLRHLWSPVPWMLEATIALQLAVGEHLEALIIIILLALNAALGVFQESRADAALALLRGRLALRVRVQRDGAWRDATAGELVPGDTIQLSLGAVVPADARIADGSLLLDQSMITGESIPAEAGPGTTAYAGAQVRRGEAIAEVVATGTRTYFGRAAELVRVAHVESSEQKAVFGIVRNLTIVNFAIVVAMVAYAHSLAMSAPQIIPLVLTAMLAAVPVALPATFTLAATLGAKTLALQGVLLTRLTALHEAAMIDVLCADKTGTLTANELAVIAVRAFGPGGEDEVVAIAALACSPEGRDPVDSAIRTWAESRPPLRETLTVRRFVPFDPAAKIAEAIAVDRDGNEIRIVKGAPAAVAGLAPLTDATQVELDHLTSAGYRTLAVASGSAGNLTVIGLIALSDPPRPESRALLAELQALGVRTVMVTGDAPATAATAAHSIGLDGPICPPGQIPDTLGAEGFAVYAGVFPEDKFRLVKAFQQSGHIVGMCGDGANDAPALRQAQMGIAVSTATDVAKAAAGLVLTDPGLGGILASIREGRAGFQRILPIR